MAQSRRLSLRLEPDGALIRIMFLLLLVAALAIQLSGCASTSDTASTNRAGDPQMRAAEDKFGIQVKALHLSASGYVLDLRYRVVDPEKASPLLDPKRKVYLLDEAHQAKLGVPESPIIGGMRQTSRNYTIYTDRDYFILFVNPGKVVRSGDKLTLAAGDLQIAKLTVE